MPEAAAAAGGERFVVTGIGASEGPARYTAALLRTALGARPRSVAFAPLSTFADAPLGQPARDATLVIFSQGVSPNARLALRHARHASRAILFTSVSGDGASSSASHPERAVARFRDDGGDVIVLPPAREVGTLVRVLGPACAMLAGAMLAGAARAEDADALVAAVESAAARAAQAMRALGDAPLGGRIAFVTVGGHGELCHAARNAWLEALCAPEPPTWDVLQIAHGPFQEFFESEIVLVALDLHGEGEGERVLWARLERMLAPDRHRLVRLCSSLPRALAAIDHLALSLELVCAALRARPRDLGCWPGSGRDGPLYDYGDERR
jgi:creatinine amidohydrolase